MIAANYGSVSDIEILWTLLAAIGASISVFNVRSAYGDWRSLGHSQNGRRTIAATQVRVELARLTIQLIFLAIGLGAMLLPEVTGTLPVRYEAYGALFRWGLITASALVTYQSLDNRMMRRTLHAHPQQQGGGQ